MPSHRPALPPAASQQVGKRNSLCVYTQMAPKSARREFRCNGAAAAAPSKLSHSSIESVHVLTTCGQFGIWVPGLLQKRETPRVGYKRWRTSAGHVRILSCSVTCRVQPTTATTCTSQAHVRQRHEAQATDGSPFFCITSRHPSTNCQPSRGHRTSAAAHTASRHASKNSSNGAPRATAQ